MLSVETESIVSKLLLNLAASEKYSEVIRQVLADQMEFDPWAIFRYFDRENKNFIDEYNFSDFLK